MYLDHLLFNSQLFYERNAISLLPISLSDFVDNAVYMINSECVCKCTPFVDQFRESISNQYASRSS